jgi:UDP-N-acetylglucosamine/UDP-N-acetylgalactosamine diphosphorylase
MTVTGTIKTLLDKGVVMPLPATVEIGSEVSPARIAGQGVVIYPGTKIYGAETVISAGVKLGYEGPVTVDNCQLGQGCELKAGFFRDSVFLAGSNMGGGAHVREGCLLEEEANAGHTVGLKQTILFPYVTLGSLINFCDCFMAGGTDRKNHSEVGSSYIHFNYTPQQDKATASLIGDVPRGVMLRERPIFLGGQGGLIGPARIGYGTVIAAGVVFRDDCPEGGKLLAGGHEKAGRNKNYHPGLYGDINRRIRNNIFYLANLVALRQWYLHVRQPFFRQELLGEALYAGALRILDQALTERLKRLDDLSGKISASLEQVAKHVKGQARIRMQAEQGAFRERWPLMRRIFAADPETDPGHAERRRFLETLSETAGRQGQYLSTIKGLSPDAVATGTCWLQQIVDDLTHRTTTTLNGGTDNT